MDVPHVANTDEIDLFELLYSLWRQKLLIISVTVIVTLLCSSSASSLPTPKEWTVRPS